MAKKVVCPVCWKPKEEHEDCFPCPDQSDRFYPRNDFVLVRIVNVEETESGIAIPQMSIEGREFHVVSCGPDVEDLLPGCKIMMVGRQNSEFWQVPNSRDLIVIKQENIVLVEKVGEPQGKDWK